MAELVDILMPASEEEGTEAVVENWLKQEGENLELHEPVLEISTDKVTMEIPSPVCGILREIMVPVGEKVEKGMILGRIEHLPESHTHEDQKKKVIKITPERSFAVDLETAREVRLSPAVRKLIREHNLEATMIPGSGRGGRVTVSDVEGFLSRLDAGEKHLEGPELENRIIPHNQMRLQIADHMITSALETAPHVTAVFDADMSRVIAHRERHKADFAKRGAKLTFTVYFIVACVQATRYMPIANGRWMDDGIQLFDHCNVGVATALEDAGLIVPVVKDAQNLDLFGIAERLTDLTDRARNKKLSVSDVKDGTITITNHGVSGSLLGTPIINQPQNAIVGIGKMEKRIKVLEIDGKEEIVIRPMIYVSLTFDHRAIDGYSANMWLGKFVEVLESW